MNLDRDCAFEKKLNTGLTSLILLCVTAKSKKPLYGYEIAKKVEGLKQGTIYPALRSLEKDGLLKSKLKPSHEGPARKYYSITKEGTKKLESWSSSWDRSKCLVDSMLE